MLTMQGVAAQGLPHSIPEQAAADHLDRWAADENRFDWLGECFFHGNVELFHQGQEYHIPKEGDATRAQARIYVGNPGDADEVLLDLLTQVPEIWLHDALTYRDAVWQGWTESYQPVAGKVPTPTWI